MQWCSSSLISFWWVLCKNGRKARVFIHNWRLMLPRRWSWEACLLLLPLQCPPSGQISSKCSFFPNRWTLPQCPKVNKISWCHVFQAVVWEDVFYRVFIWFPGCMYHSRWSQPGRDYWEDYAFWPTDINLRTVCAYLHYCYTKLPTYNNLGTYDCNLLINVW